MIKEELLFHMFKDTTRTSTDVKRGELQKKHPDVNISNLHRRIINYQIKKYGISLNDYNQNKIESGIKIAKSKNIRRRRRNGR